MTHGFKEKYSISYTNRIRKFDAVFRMFTKVVVGGRMPSCLVEDGLCFVKWNLICCIEELFYNLYQQYDGFVFFGNTAWICQWILWNRVSIGRAVLSINKNKKWSRLGTECGKYYGFTIAGKSETTARHLECKYTGHSHRLFIACIF